MNRISAEYSRIEPEYEDSFSNQIDHFDDRISDLQRSKTDLQETVEKLRATSANIQTTFEVMRVKSEIIESFIVAYRLPSVTINQSLQDGEAKAFVSGEENKDPHPQNQGQRNIGYNLSKTRSNTLI